MKFYFDENLSKYVARALNILQQRLNRRNNTSHSIKAIGDAFRKGIKDPELFKKLPADAVLITLDINQQRRWQERISIQKEKVSIIYIRSKRTLRYWQMVLLFINAWQDILEHVDTNKHPFLKIYRPADIRSYIRN